MPFGLSTMIRAPSYEASTIRQGCQVRPFLWKYRRPRSDRRRSFIGFSDLRGAPQSQMTRDDVDRSFAMAFWLMLNAPLRCSIIPCRGGSTASFSLAGQESKSGTQALRGRGDSQPKYCAPRDASFGAGDVVDDVAWTTTRRQPDHWRTDKRARQGIRPTKLPAMR